ncbi:BrnT family toxin [Nitrospira moscoviensis]|uniref:BrnT family toxin n=1 Tax=Nitrospira moscoviensis TaxID=42253 RepID=UPI0009F90865
MFSWDARKAIANFEKHRISFEEAATIFGDANALDGSDEEHSADEHRRQRIGRSVAGRIVYVVYTVRRVDHEKETIRIISARQASRRERAAYSRLSD